MRGNPQPPHSSRKANMPGPDPKTHPALGPAELAALPASERIRYRLIGADCRYHANDNIAAHIREGEIEELKAEVQAKMQGVLQSRQRPQHAGHRPARGQDVHR